MEEAAEELERSNQSAVFCNQLVARVSGDGKGTIAPVRAPVEAQCATAGSERQHGLSHIVASRDVLESELNTWMCMMVIRK